MTVKVKDMIAYLQQFDTELPIILDKDGWEECDDINEAISYLIGRCGNCLIVNN